LLRHGLLKASYIPNREQRELREITRYRKSLIEERSREINRLQKMLEENPSGYPQDNLSSKPNN
jgi:transposase